MRMIISTGRILPDTQNFAISSLHVHHAHKLSYLDKNTGGGEDEFGDDRQGNW
jgi:hypothetical protein